MNRVRQLLKKFYANKTLFIIVCVVCLASLTMGISYSAFFSVKTNSINQVVQTGSLSVTYSGNNSAIAYDYVEPLTDDEGMAQTANRIVTVQNTSSLNSKYTLTVGYDMENFLGRADYNSNDELTPIEYVRLALYEYDTTNSTSTLISGPISISDLPIFSLNNSDSRYNRYSLLIDTVGSTTSGNATKTYQIKIWLSDDATSAATDTYFYINSEVVARPDGDTLNYTINGMLQNADGTAISGATISLHNGSIVATTNAKGVYKLENVPMGTYNLDITASGVKYSGNLTISEGSDVSVTNLGSYFSVSGNNIYNVANMYKTTPGKIMSFNDIYDITNDISLNGYYDLLPTFNLTGSAEKSINGLNIILSNGYIADMNINNNENSSGYIYWNNDYPLIYDSTTQEAATFSLSSLPTKNYSSFDSLRIGTNYLRNWYIGMDDMITYIKQNNSERSVCVYYNHHEFCLKKNYWVSGDSDGSLTANKLCTDMSTTFGLTFNDVSESSYIMCSYFFDEYNNISCGLCTDDEVGWGDYYCDVALGALHCDLNDDGTALCYTSYGNTFSS